MQEPAFDSSVDRVPAHPDRLELSARHHPVLLVGEGGNRGVEVTR
jgi:hypothetical protein